MKKILSIALVAALALTSVFAVSISGQADMGFNYDIDAKTFYFDNNGKMNKVEFKFSDEFFNETKEVVGEGDIYAGIKATMTIDWPDMITVGEIKNDTDWKKNFGYDGYEFSGTLVGTGFGGTWDVYAAIEEAYITNGTWKLNILGSKAASDYAVSAVDKYEDDKKTYSVSAVAPSAKKANAGFVFTMDGYTASLGLVGNGSAVDFNAMVETKAYDLESATVQAAIVGGKVSATDTLSFGASVKGGFKTEDVAINAAADAAIVKVGSADAAFNLDLAAKMVGFGVTADVYFALDATGVNAAYAYRNKNLLSAKVAYETTIEDIKASVTFTGLDLINSQDLEASISGSKDKVAATVYGGYIVVSDTWKAGAAVTYTAEKYTATASVDAATGSLKVAAGVTSDKIVAGATLAAGYESGNLLASTAVIGTLSASATIKF